MRVNEIKGALIDSNEIIYLLENKIDLFSLLEGSMLPLRFYTLRANVNEVKAITRNKSIEDWLKAQNIKIIESDGGKPDDLLLAEAEKRKLCIFTEDKNLAKKAKEMGLIAIKLKNKRKIEFY
jgi:rRNA-processing protein FCF1